MDIIIIFDIEMSNEYMQIKYMSNEQINVHSTYACPIDIIMSNQDLCQIYEWACSYLTYMCSRHGTMVDVNKGISVI
jgi:hypothetical protein